MRPLSYAGYRFPPEIIQHAIWLYLRFTLSFRDVEELLAERGIDVSHETIRRWVAVFGPMIARRLWAMRAKPHTTWHLDEGRRSISPGFLRPRRVISTPQKTPLGELSGARRDPTAMGSGAVTGLHSICRSSAEFPCESRTR